MHEEGPSKVKDPSDSVTTISRHLFLERNFVLTKTLVKAIWLKDKKSCVLWILPPACWRRPSLHQPPKLIRKRSVARNFELCTHTERGASDASAKVPTPY